MNDCSFDLFDLFNLFGPSKKFVLTIGAYVFSVVFNSNFSESHG